MWRWNNNGSASDNNSTSVIDLGCEFEGRLRFAGTLVINGKYHGEMVSAGTLLVGESAELEAQIHVGVAIVSGQVSGSITALQRVELRTGARIAGDIITPSLVLEEGVIFDGRCGMIDTETAAAQKSS
jgi:cytoskeletal protein CcmA (bactofilin family)